MGIADCPGNLTFHGPVTGGTTMNAGKPTRFGRVEGFVRGMLALALLAGVVWALTDGGAAPSFDFATLRH